MRFQLTLFWSTNLRSRCQAERELRLASQRGGCAVATTTVVTHPGHPSIISRPLSPGRTFARCVGRNGTEAIRVRASKSTRSLSLLHWPDIRCRSAADAHNAGRCHHTESGRPWRLDVVLEFTDEARAVRFEAVPEIRIRLRLRKASPAVGTLQASRRDRRARRRGRPARRRDRLRGVPMTERSLQVTYRKGRTFAAYLHLSHPTGEKSARTVASPDGLLIVDYSASGKPLGVEITAPQAVPLDQLNQLLAELGESPLAEQDCRPARAA